jgi:glycosyltransferase involved in cell wall biosynthesis
MNPKITVIIPNYNGESTLEDCLSAVYASCYDNFEVIVVDDCSQDQSVDIIKRFPCRLIELSRHSGASAARNAGARVSQGAFLFFTDSDCVLQETTLTIAYETLLMNGPRTIIGGTYEPQSYDNGFYSQFQSVFIHYSETKHSTHPDYIATHAMAIDRETFKASGGFREQWLPILEDVEFSHRLRATGHVLFIDSNIQVQHIFNFSLSRSFRNALRKSRYWTQYSMDNGDLLSDSGTASHELKTNVVLFYPLVVCMALILISSVFTPVIVSVILGSILLLGVITNLWVNQRLVTAFYNAYGMRFSCSAMFYYFCVYPIPVSIGSLMGVFTYFNSAANNPASSRTQP